MAWMSQYKLHESRRGLELKFFHNIFSMGFNSIYAKVKVVGNLLIGVLSADELENFFLPAGEVKLLKESVVGFKVLNGEIRAERETGLPGIYQVNGMIKVLSTTILEQVAMGTGMHSFCYEVRIIVPTQDDHFYPGILFSDKPGGFQSIHNRHINIYQGNIREPAMQLVQQFEAIGGYVGDAEGRVSTEEMTDSGGEKPVIVRQHNVNRHVRSLQVHE